MDWAISRVQLTNEGRSFELIVHTNTSQNQRERERSTTNAGRYHSLSPSSWRLLHGVAVRPRQTLADPRAVAWLRQAAAVHEDVRRMLGSGNRRGPGTGPGLGPRAPGPVGGAGPRAQAPGSRPGIRAWHWAPGLGPEPRARGPGPRRPGPHEREREREREPSPTLESHWAGTPAPGRVTFRRWFDERSAGKPMVAWPSSIWSLSAPQ